MRRTICMILTAAAVLTLTGCGGGYDTYRLYPNEFLLGESVSDFGEVVARSSTGAMAATGQEAQSGAT